MAKTLKKLFRLFTILLTMIALLAVPVYAGEYNGGGEDGLDPNKDHGVYEGISSARSGYLIWLSDGSGKSINGKVVCATADGSEPYTKTGCSLSIYDQGVVTNSACNNPYAYDGDCGIIYRKPVNPHSASAFGKRD